LILNNRQIRMLQLLDEQVNKCNKCSLKSNGKFIPFWTPYSKYAIIGESPNHREITRKTPFLGSAGEILTKQLYETGFKSRDFLVINTVQCATKFGLDNKPNNIQICECQSFIRKYLKVVNPEKILCLGNYAKYIFTNTLSGVLKQRGKFFNGKLEGDVNFPFLITVNPAYCIYNDIEGINLLRSDIELFRNTRFQRKADWLFTEDDFLI